MSSHAEIDLAPLDLDSLRTLYGIVRTPLASVR
jgi:hypothetical protein